MIEKLKDVAKAVLKRSPIALSQNHRYDLQTRRILTERLRPDDNCVDVGCHKGEILDLMLRAAPRGHHHGFEPIPALAEGLEERFRHEANCTIHNLALSDVAGTADFNYVISNPSYSGLKRRDYDRAGERDTNIRVRTARLDDVLPEDYPVGLIKIDVEGGELEVLRGATRVLSRYKPIVIFEHGLGASDKYGASPEDVYAQLVRAGLTVATLNAFLEGGKSLKASEFAAQYHHRMNYYFVGYSRGG